MALNDKVASTAEAWLTDPTDVRALTMLGRVCQQGELAPAPEHLHQRLALSRQIGNRLDEAKVLTMLGELLHERGEFAPADTCNKRLKRLTGTPRSRPGIVRISRSH